MSAGDKKKKGVWGFPHSGGKTKAPKAAPEKVGVVEATSATPGQADQELLDAAEQGELNKVRALLDAHKDDPGYVSARDKSGATALHCAAMGPHIEICELLIREGANVVVANAESTTPLHYVVRKAPKKSTGPGDEAPAPPSLTDLLSGRRSQYIRLLDLMLEKGANIDAQSMRAETPLHQACTRNNEEAVRWLLTNNADLHLTNKIKETPLAGLHGKETIIAELLAHADADDPTLTSRGVLTWGSGQYGALGYPLPTNQNQPTPRQAPDSQVFSAFNERCIVSIACGSYVTAALTSNAEVFIWGRVKSTSLSGGEQWYLLGTGADDSKEVEYTPVLLNLPPVSQISLGVNHGAVVLADGEIRTWGYGGNGQLGHGELKSLSVPNTVTALGKNVWRVACCMTHTIALTKDKRVWTWGGNESGQLGLGDVAERTSPTRIESLEDVVGITGSQYHSACVTSSGSVYIWGNTGTQQQTSPTIVNFFEEHHVHIVSLACGPNLTVAVSDTGDTYTWGAGRQLGHPDTTSESSPRLVDGLKDKSVRRVSCNTHTFFALTDKGQAFAVGRDSWGQCGTKGGEVISVPTRVNNFTLHVSPPPVPTLRDVVSVACGERHSACVMDVSRSLRDRYVWKILELLRSLLRGLNVLVELYQLPLKSKHGHSDVRARIPPGATVPFVMEGDINTLFNPVATFINFTSNLIFQFDEIMDTWGPTTSCFGNLFISILDCKDVVSYFDNLPKALVSIETICGVNPQFIGYLQECRQFGEKLRKADPYEEENKDMELGPLLMDPYFVFERIQKLLEGIKRHTPLTHPDRSTITEALQHLTARLRAIKDSMIQQDSKLSMLRAPSVRYLSAQYDNLVEYKSLCKKVYKQAKRISSLQRTLADERTTFSSLVALLGTCVGAEETQLSAALEAYSDLARRLGLIDINCASRIEDNFIHPMHDFVADLDATLPTFIPQKKAADDAYHDYNAILGKLLNVTRLQKDPKKAAEVEKEVQLTKRKLDFHAGELNSRLRSVSDKKESVQWAFLRAMRSDTDASAQAVDRSQTLLPYVDALESGLRAKSRKEWGVQLKAQIHLEMANLPPDHAHEDDAIVLRGSMSKLDEPYVLGGPIPNYLPLVELLASPTLSVLNSLVATAEGEEQELVLRCAVRILDAYQKAIPLIKRGITIEVETTVDPGTLFRLNSIATRLMTAYTRQTGLYYLQRTLKPFILEILQNPSLSYEVDPLKAPPETVDENMVRLLALAQRIIDAIVHSTTNFPLQLRVLTSHLMREVARKFPASRQTAVGGFVFLRFICPALLAPGGYNLLDTTSHDGCRAFVLLSKVLQNLSNGLEFTKELFMHKANQFIASNLEKVRAFFDSVASLPASHPHPPTITTIENVTAYDLRVVHVILVKNLNKVIKSLAAYKCKDVIPSLWWVITELDNPANPDGTLTLPPPP